MQKTVSMLVLGLFLLTGFIGRAFATELKTVTLDVDNMVCNVCRRGIIPHILGKHFKRLIVRQPQWLGHRDLRCRQDQRGGIDPGHREGRLSIAPETIGKRLTHWE